jgi:NADH:ubiquinone oxidoreductase subunit E
MAGCTAGLCVAVLLADYATAAMRGPAATAPAATQPKITAARLARRSRDKAVGWVLIAAAAIFLTAANRMPRRARAKKALRNAEAAIPQLPTREAAALSLDFVEEAVARLGRGKEAAVALLQAMQAHYRYLPDEGLRRLCELTEITPAEIAGTSSFYAGFRRSPVGEHVVRVCHGTACHVSGARQIGDELRRYLGIPEGADTDAAHQFTVDEVACLGCCSLAPVLMVDGHPAGKLTPAGACRAVRARV